MGDRLTRRWLRGRVNLSLAILLAFGGMFQLLQPAGAGIASAADSGTIIHVTVTGGVYARDGKSWETAFRGDELQQAIDGAPAGSQVWVAEGTYYPTQETGGTGDRYRAFRMKNGVAIYGGFPANPDPDTGMDDRNWTNYPTILSGDTGMNDIPGDFGNNRNDNVYHVIRNTADLALDNTAILDGFTIKGGDARYGDGKGGGILNESGRPKLRNLLVTDNAGNLGGGMYDMGGPELENATIRGNKSEAAGGGLYINIDLTDPATPTAKMTLSNVVLESNSSPMGGGLYVQSGTVEMQNSTLQGNTTTQGGGGFYSAGSVIIRDSVIKDNTATASGGLGGGIYHVGSIPGAVLELTRVTVEGNSSGLRAGGMVTANTTTLKDVTIKGNHTGSVAGGMMIGAGTVTLQNVSFDGNTSDQHAGGLWIAGGSIKLQDVSFTGNIAQENGGGIYAAAAASLVNVTFAGNQAKYGGGFYNVGGNSTLTNVLISGNKATESGGGFVLLGGNPTLTNVTIGGNSAAVGGGMYAQDSGNGVAAVRNSIIRGNGASDGKNVSGSSSKFLFAHSLIEGSGGSGEDWNASIGTDNDGNIDADPLFRNPVKADDAPTTAGDYRVAETSPAVDAGSDSAFQAGATPDLSAVTTDLAGGPRKRYGAVDMGAYEFVDETAPAITGKTPVSGGKNVAVDVKLELTFSEPVSAVAGKKIRVRKSDDTLAADVDAGAAAVNGAAASITLPSELAFGTDYYVTIDQGAFVDRAGNELAAIADRTAWTFSTVPATEVKLEATAGNRTVDLVWNAIPEADAYEIYRREAGGSYGHTPIATLTATAFTAEGLTNGTTYSFKIRAMKGGSEVTVSNEAEATPMTVPGAPTNVAASAGDGQATVTFMAPAESGGSPITEYVVTASPGGKTASGTSGPITVTGLTNGTSYTFTVKAVNKVGAGEASAPSNAVVPRKSGGGNPSPSQPSNPEPSGPPTGNTGTTGVYVLVNGKAESAGTATTGTRNGRTVTTITLDESRLEERLAAEGPGTRVTIPVGTGSEIAVGELNGQMVKAMEDHEAVLEIRTDRAVYTLPAGQIHIGAIAGRIGSEVALQDIKMQIEIAEPSAESIRLVENAAADGSFTPVVPPIEFTVRAVHEDSVIEVATFTAYVERMIAIPDGADPERITTAVAVDPDGAVRHVPTRVERIDGRYYAIVSSLTNSTYTVVWHPVEFADVAGHWARDAVNDMGSRMVIGGVGGNLYEPEREVTRAEFAAIIIRALGLKPEEGKAPFADVHESDWYNGAVLTARAYGLIDGYADGTFRPDEKVTREQAMTILSRAMAVTGLKQPSSADDPLSRFADAADVSAWARSGVADALRGGIATGRSGGTLAPQDGLTRAEAAALAQRLLRNAGLI
ncbi:MAG: hypothetical protein C6W55_07420 [Thermobacillus sp.]|uniref:S-layer homology domain-containing protein n=1 Tax=Thermobacillus sp. TaxID=2108467 RepID=UPI000E374EB3|nr:S-layer homology domain-containing protein [Thermobacillus sp.]REK56570.1 MAG: hypothetical protein C6W55_07420 [Thermobacillus sp.]